MMYTRSELDFRKKDEKLLEEARKRYLHKFTHYPNEIKKLCLHEKEFLFRYLTWIISVKDKELDINSFTSQSAYETYLYLKKLGKVEKTYDLFKIEAANEYLFNKVILNHFPDYRFCPPMEGAHGPLEADEILKDKDFFNMYKPIWMEMLKSGKGAYATHLKTEYVRKMKILNGYRKSSFIGYNLYKQKECHVELALYHIFYIVKHFFDAEKSKCYQFEIGSNNFVFDIYSYVHILSRHYMPDINSLDFTKTFNSDLTFIDLWNLPTSIKQLIVNYNEIQQFEKNEEREFIIFQSKRDYYILWLRYQFIDSIKRKGYHIRTFYKVKGSKDLAKIDSLIKINFNDDLAFFVR